MIRLSRAGWNNVLIFSSLIMIALLNGLHRNLLPSHAASEQTLLPSDALIVSIEFSATEASPAFQLQRVGKSWRRVLAAEDVSIEAVDVISTQAEANIVLQWQNLLLPLVAEDIAQTHVEGYQTSRVITVWLAGRADAAVFEFHAPSISATSGFIHHQQANQWLSLDQTAIQMLGLSSAYSL